MHMDEMLYLGGDDNLIYVPWWNNGPFVFDDLKEMNDSVLEFVSND